MLVDDEEEVRTSIIRKINWEANGFEVVGDAENGRDVLEKIEILEPNDNHRYKNALYGRACAYGKPEAEISVY